MRGGQIRSFVSVLYYNLCHIGVKNAAAEAIEEVVGIGFLQATDAHSCCFFFDCTKEATCSEAGSPACRDNVVLKEVWHLP